MDDKYIAIIEAVVGQAGISPVIMGIAAISLLIKAFAQWQDTSRETKKDLAEESELTVNRILVRKDQLLETTAELVQNQEEKIKMKDQEISEAMQAMQEVQLETRELLTDLSGRMQRLEQFIEIVGCRNAPICINRNPLEQEILNKVKNTKIGLDELI